MLAFIRCSLSSHNLLWVDGQLFERVMRFLVNTTEPLMGRAADCPAGGRFDISPIGAFIIIWIFQAAVAGTLLRGWQ